MWRRTEVPGFTLLEILIVVLIVTILSGIAVPHFLEFQTRSKVAKVRQELTTIATALEAYHADNDTYPPDWNWDHPDTSDYQSYQHLSTPIGYISRPPFDPFFIISTPRGNDDYYQYWAESPAVGPSWTPMGINWVVYSYGPDAEDNLIGFDPYLYIDGHYDPTNGTVSIGDIGRSNSGVIDGEK